MEAVSKNLINKLINLYFFILPNMILPHLPDVNDLLLNLSQIF